MQPDGAPPAPPTRRVWWLAATATVVSLVLALALAEVAVRVRAWVRHGTGGRFDELTRRDSTLGGLKVLIPGASNDRVHVNQLGFRGPEIPVPKPDSVIRIAFLGGSTTYCEEVSGDSAVWPHLVTTQLRETFPGQAFDYVNAGVPGYAFQSMRRILNARVTRTQPDVIVIYEATNELYVETRAILDSLGVKAERPDNTGWLARHSKLWFLVDRRLRLWRVQREQQARGVPPPPRLDPDSLGARFRKDLTGLVDAARATGAVVAVATFSHRLRPEQTPEERSRAALSSLFYMPYMTPDGLMRSYARYNRITAEVAQAAGVLLIGGENDIPADSVHFVDTVHFTDEGSRVMARRIAGFLGSSPAIAQLVASRRAAAAAGRPGS